MTPTTLEEVTIVTRVGIVVTTNSITDTTPPYLATLSMVDSKAQSVLTNKTA